MKFSYTVLYVKDIAQAIAFYELCSPIEPMKAKASSELVSCQL